MSQQQPQPDPQPQSASDGLENAFAAAVALTAAEGDCVLMKGPKGPKKNGEQAARKSESKLHQIVSSSSVTIQVPMQHAYMQAQQQQQLLSNGGGVNSMSPQSCTLSPATPQEGGQSWLGQQPQHSEEDDFLRQLLGDFPNGQAGAQAYDQMSGGRCGGACAGGCGGCCGQDIAAPIRSMPPPPMPPPPIPPPPTPPMSAPGVNPVSETTKQALIRRLRPASSQQTSVVAIVDENFNTPLHQAVLQQQSAESVDFLLSDLNDQEKLLPIINLVNCNGHTPLSLCLKMRRPDLIPLLIAFDAAPTQLCGPATERTNHFHYALSKCVDSIQSFQLVCSLLSAVCKNSQLDLYGMLAKNRHGKTAMDSLRHRISQLNNHQNSDPASVELLRKMQMLQQWLIKQFGTS